MIEVYKFGGTCLKNKETITQVSELIQNYIETDDSRLVVTVSASMGITRQIDSRISPFMSAEEVNSLMDMLREHHTNLLKSSSEDIINRINEELNRLKKLIYGIIYLEEIKPEVHDLILSFGERIMVLVLQNYLEETGVSNKIIYPEEFVLTNDIFKSSSILLEETNVLGSPIIQNKLEDNKVLIIPGFYGKSKTGKINLLGKSGTDYTGAVLAYLSNAVNYTIWKDVLGFMTADPKMVENASTIENLSYDEAEELSFYGATLIHDKVINIIKKKRIKLFIRHLFQLDKVTTIHEETLTAPGIKSISHIPSVIYLSIGKDDILSNNEIQKLILERLNKTDIKLLSFYISGTSISLIFTDSYFESISNILDELGISTESRFAQHLSYIVLVGQISPVIISEITNQLSSCIEDLHISKNMIRILVKNIELQEALEYLHTLI